MLEYLEIENAGPADHLRLDLAPRLNLLTGDNGLGKSFLLDIIWWTFALNWPSQTNHKIVGGLSVRPKNNSSLARISFRRLSGNTVPMVFRRVWLDWMFDGPPEIGVKTDDCISLYLRSDGSFCTYDYSRNIKRGDILGLERAEPLVFNDSEIWNGYSTENTKHINGLLSDISSWQKEKSPHFVVLKSVLESLSPGGIEKFEIGKPTRINPDDSRDIPTIKTPYGDIPLVHVSSGIRRIITLSYLLVWSWQEHIYATDIRGLKTANRIVLLIDELDAHLHPKWQRTIIRSLMKVMEVLAPEVKVQIIAATHSPLVMASVEPFFDPAQDAWFDLDLNRETGQVEVTKRSEHWYRRGDADAWLKSEAFDQKSGYAPETEQVLERAGAALQNENITKEEALKIDSELRGSLAESDPFWKRWEYIAEKKGWLEE